MKTLRLLVAVIVASAASAFAQVFTSPTQTTAAYDLWVVPGGSDKASCIFPNMACKTIGGAINKLPDVINHKVTVHLLSTSYTESPTLQDKTMGSSGAVIFTAPSATTITGSFNVLNMRGGNPGSVSFSNVTATPLPASASPLTGPTTLTTLYVDAVNGDDSRTCTAPLSGSCKTHQRALNMLPKLLRNGVLINTADSFDGGPANYPCFYVNGFVGDFGYQTTDGGILIDGTRVTVTPVGGGTGTGTLTSVTNGNGITFSTSTDSTQTWASNSLQGYLMEITAGTGVGGVKPIESNTSTTVNIVGTWSPAPTAGSTYAIRQPGWTITTACPAPGGMTAAATANQAGVLIYGNQMSYRSNAIILRNVGFSYAAGAGVIIDDNSSVGLLNYRQVLNSGSGVSTTQNGNPRINLNTGTFTGSGFGYAASSLGGATINVNTILSYGNNAGLALSSSGIEVPAWSVLTSSAMTLNVAGVLFASVASGSQVSLCHFNCLDSTDFGAVFGASSVSMVTDPSGGTGYGSANVYMSQNTISSTCSVGIVALGRGTNVYEDRSAGALAATGYLVNYGGRIHHVANSNLTGATQDISLDNGTRVAAFGDITTASCNITDAGVSLYGSQFCK